MNAAESSTSPTLLRALSGSASSTAWSVFVGRYTPLVNERCRRAGLQVADIDDVRQQVFAQLVKALAEFHYDPARRFRGYLSRVIDNAIATHWRQLARRPGSVGRGGDLPEPLAALAGELDDLIRERMAVVMRVVEHVRFEVGPEVWAAFWLTAIEGLSGDEAAVRLGKKASAIYVAKSRVLMRLRESMNDSEPDS